MKSILLGTTLPLLACAAIADELPLTVGRPIVVTAARANQALGSTIMHTTVITRADIERSQVPDLLSLLRREAGFQSYQSGGIGKQSSSFVRGTNSNQTLVLIDGVRVNSATTGATALEQIMLSNVERVEIVRGNVSSLYGSEAVGGVIQIFTRRGEGAPTLSAELMVGSYGTDSEALNYGGKTGDTRFNVGVSRFRTRGYSAIRPEFIPAPFVSRPADVDRDGYGNTTLSATVSHAIDARNEIGATALQSMGDVQYDGTSANRSRQDVGAFSVYSANQLTDQWNSRVTLSQGSDDLRSWLDAAPKGRYHTTNTTLSWHNDVQLAAEHRVTGGLEHLRQAIDPTPLTAGAVRNVDSALLGYLWQSPRQTVQINGRVDRYSDFGAQPSGLLGYGYDFTSDWRVTASYATAFKAPTFNDLYSMFGNPALKPEKARTYELGLQYQHGAQLARATYFNTRVRDLISFVPPNFTAVNFNKAKIDGVEVSYSGKAGTADVKASATFERPVDALTGLPLLRRAKRTASLEAYVPYEKWQLGGDVFFSGPRDDIHIATFQRIQLPGYAVLNLVARYRFDSHTDFSLRLANALDKDYMPAHGYNPERRALYGTVGYRF